MVMVIEPELLKELSHFEMFFSRIGFKRIDGSVYGLLVMARKPLTSEEIETTLNLSQSAVSLSLKTLTQYGAVESRDDRDNRDTKAKLHFAKEDSLSIVASVFRKREEEMVADFKRMAQRVLEKSGDLENDHRKKRLQSIITTCEIAESVMNFVITIAQTKIGDTHEVQYEALMKRIPKAIDLLATTAGPLTDMTVNLREKFRVKFKNNLKDHL
jgi:DNA-binding transcriptional regulator GbsR (MarR family)